MTVCKRVIYSGQVQGVGFRATARYLADGFAVSGTVRNRADGSVELVVQGEPDQVDRLLTAIALRMRPYVARRQVEDTACTALEGFHIIS
jgi:acylphosphatase